jgi:hypothetical protein
MDSQAQICEISPYMKLRVLSGLFLVILTTSLCSPVQNGWAEGTSVSSPTSIPKTPSAPPALFQRPAPESFRCQRNFVYDGKVIGCDSNVRPDGEGLRPYLRDVPLANAQLNEYQRNRAGLRNTAYFGSLGLAVLIGGLVAGGGTGKQLMVLSGSTIVAGSFLYGFTTARSNENHLNEAIRLHNLAKPDKPIELQFSTGIGF